MPDDLFSEKAESERLLGSDRPKNESIYTVTKILAKDEIDAISYQTANRAEEANKLKEANLFGLDS